MMQKRYSHLAGRVLELPTQQKEPAAADQIAELRVLLAAETAKREAAEARCLDLQARLTEADQRAERIAADLERAHGRMETLAAIPAPQPQSITFPEPPPPVGYQAVVTARDVDGKIKAFDLIPKE